MLLNDFVTASPATRHAAGLLGLYFTGRDQSTQAGDELTMTEVATLLSSTLGRNVTYEPTPIELVRTRMPELALMYEWFVRIGYDAEIQSLRRLRPQLMNFETWLKQSEFAKAGKATTASAAR